jgi:hypothetical protein
MLPIHEKAARAMRITIATDHQKIPPSAFFTALAARVREPLGAFMNSTCSCMEESVGRRI